MFTHHLNTYYTQCKCVITGGDKLSEANVKHLSSYTFQLSMDLILEQLWELCDTGFRMKNICGGRNNGERGNYRVVPFVARAVMDLVEVWDTLSLKFNTHPFVKIRSKGDLSNVKVWRTKWGLLNYYMRVMHYTRSVFSVYT